MMLSSRAAVVNPTLLHRDDNPIAIALRGLLQRVLAGHSLVIAALPAIANHRFSGNRYVGAMHSR